MKILITAGPTREMLDPVRFLSNLSTGYMGYTLAEEARKQGHLVTLVTGPTGLKAPLGVTVIPITGAGELQHACEKEFKRHDVLIMTAAVCDYTPVRISRRKIKRVKTHRIHLKQTPDIVAGLAKKKKHQIVVGFCLETEAWIENAKLKMQRKNLDAIVANYCQKRHIPFGDKKINTAFLNRSGVVQQWDQNSKRQIARKLLVRIAALRAGESGKNELS